MIVVEFIKYLFRYIDKMSSLRGRFSSKEPFEANGSQCELIICDLVNLFNAESKYKEIPKTSFTLSKGKWRNSIDERRWRKTSGHHKLINYFHLHFTLDTEKDGQQHWHVKAQKGLTMNRGLSGTISLNTRTISVIVRDEKSCSFYMIFGLWTFIVDQGQLARGKKTIRKLRIPENKRRIIITNFSTHMTI